MRIGFISNFSPGHAECEIADYLELEGHRVARYQHSHLDKQKFLAMSFDMVLTVLPQCYDLEFWQAVKASGATLVAWHSDWIQEPQQQGPYLKHLPVFDQVFSSDGFDSSWYENHGINRSWLQSACDTRVYKTVKGSAKYICEVAFVGHLHRLGYRPAKRVALVKRLAAEFDFKHLGDDSKVYGREHAVICNSAKIMVCENYREDVPGYWSDRVYMEVGAGAFVLHPRVPGLERHFKDGVHLVTYDGLDELCEKVRYYLERPGDRERIARAGQAHVHENHSQERRVKEFLRCISGSSVTRTRRAASASSRRSSLTTSA